VMYTSGSTGIPKGVGVPHRGIVRLVRHNWYARLDEHQVFLQLAPLAFDASTLELWGSLLNGARLVLFPEEAPDLQVLAHVLKEQGVTLLWLTAGLLQQVVREVPEALAGVQELLAGGEVLSPEPVRQLLRQHAGQQVIINGYGPTENTTFTCCYRTSQLSEVHSPLPIGTPLSNSRVYVLDAHRQLVPLGVVGELYTAGDGLARGYLGHPELTAERFVPDPYSTEPGGRLYRTGDLVRWQADGQMAFVGRADGQVKLRGYRIELGEIEAALQQLPAVQQAVVLAREEQPTSKQLVAYVVPQEPEHFSWETVRAALEERLPEYMVPARHVVLSQLPLTPNGKLDRRALPAWERADLGEEPRSLAARTPMEAQLVQIWQQVLGIERVGIQENFFALGGDSILSLQVVSRARQQGLSLTPRQLFQHPTIAELAAQAQRTEEATPLLAEQGLVSGEVPLTPIQHWFFQQEQPEPHHWNQALLLKTTLAPSLLQAARLSLLKQHDAGRLRFDPTLEGWRQSHAQPALSLPLLQVDLTQVPAGMQPLVLGELADQVQASLDLAEGPLLRAVCFELGAPQGNRLLVVLHHLVVDVVSWRILLQDLQTVCEQLSRGETVCLPAKSTSWQQWARRLEQYSHSEPLARQLPYWLQQARLPVASLPLDRLQGANSVASAQSVQVSLSAQETQVLLHEVPGVYHTQITEVLLTALAQALWQWTGERSHRIDLEGHGREDLFADLDLSRTVGWFTSLSPVVLQLPEGEQDLGVALKAIKEQ